MLSTYQVNKSLSFQRSNFGHFQKSIPNQIKFITMKQCSHMKFMGRKSTLYTMDHQSQGKTEGGGLQPTGVTETYLT